MKTTKRLFAMLLSVVLVFAMAIPAFADTTYSITIENAPDGHTYKAYQLLTGKLEEVDGNKVLSDVVFGANLDKYELDGTQTAVEGEDATEFAKSLVDKNEREMLDYAKESIAVKGTAVGTADTKDGDGNYVISGLVPGYYLVKDETNVQGADDTISSYIIKVVGDVTQAPKTDKPTVDKQVKDEAGDKDANADENGWGETADHAMNESFDFKLIASIPDEEYLDDYSTYKLVFHDEMSAGVTYEGIDSVTFGTKTLTEDDYSVTTSTNTETGVTTLTITITDLMALCDEDVTTIKGQDVTVIYSAHLNENAVLNNNDDNQNNVYLEYSNDPYSTSTGATTKDYVFVFTYDVDNLKTDGDTNDALDGAGFKLYKGDDEVALYYDTVNNVYRPVAEGETAVDEMMSANGGKFNVIGLDTGDYTLKETTVPTGYNKAADYDFSISATHQETGDGATAETSYTTTLVNTIANYKGTVLPETGGIGTTIFYVAGGVLVIGAVIFLVTRRRTDAEEA